MRRPSHPLDINTCIYLIRQRPVEALRRFGEFEVGEIGISVITVSELRYGVEKSSRPMQNAQALSRFLLTIEVLGFGAEAAREYGSVRADLERLGTPIGPLDTLIAAQVRSLDATLVTSNTREFELVQGLKLDDWTPS